MSASGRPENTGAAKKAKSGKRLSSRFGRRQAPVMPAKGVAGKPLLIAVTIMCYFACITIGAVALINQVVDSWTSAIASQVTIQIKPVRGIKPEAQIKQAIAIVKAAPGVISAKAQSARDAARMLEPWLGAGNVLDDLPIPRLIHVQVDGQSPPDLAAISKKLAAKVKGAVLDDHSRWRTELTRTATLIQAGAYSVLALVIMTTIAIIIFATRATMASNRDIVEVLHLIGARESYIARQFQTHFLMLGLKSGLMGLVLGVMTYILFNIMMGADSDWNLASLANAEMIGSLALDLKGFLPLLAVPPAAALISVMTSRLSVLKFLSSIG